MGRFDLSNHSLDFKKSSVRCTLTFQKGLFRMSKDHKAGPAEKETKRDKKPENFLTKFDK